MTTTQSQTIQETLAERASRYGDFTDHARIAQELKDVMQNTEKWHELGSMHREALDMICHKIARILNGDPNYADSWHDIAGYAKLVEDRILPPAPPPPPPPPPPPRIYREGVGLVPPPKWP